MAHVLSVLENSSSLEKKQLIHSMFPKIVVDKTKGQIDIFIDSAFVSPNCDTGGKKFNLGKNGGMDGT